MPSAEPPPLPALRVALVEDEGLMRSLLVEVLSGRAGLEVVGAFDAPEAAEAGLADGAVDVVLLDLHLGPAAISGIELARRLQARQPGLGVVLFSNQIDPTVLTALTSDEGASWSFLDKASIRDFSTLERALRGAAEGLVVLDASLARRLVHGRRAKVDLNERLQQLLMLLAQGYSNQAIARELCLAEKSVENLLSQLYRQLAIDTSNGARHPRVQATLHYLRLNSAG